MTYAAFYLPKETTSPIKVDHKLTSELKNRFQSAKRTSKQKFRTVSFSQIARNMNIQGTTAFAQRYAVGAVSKIMNGEPITNKTMMDSLFNTYAPALNLGLAQTGYNSLMQMKDAAFHGTINPANFLEGFSSGLQAVTDSLQSDNFADRYGDEIPIDVVEQLTYTYDSMIAEKFVPLDVNSTDYIYNIKAVIINFTGHIKNKNAELWEVNDTLQTLGNAQTQKTFVTLRIGKSIYENCIIRKMEPVITNINEIKLVIELKYDYYSHHNSKKTKYGHIMNPRASRTLNNHLAKEVYTGTVIVT